jgi:hypothetical protein
VAAESLGDLGVGALVQLAGHRHLGDRALLLEGEGHVLVRQAPDHPHPDQAGNFGR